MNKTAESLKIQFIKIIHKYVSIHKLRAKHNRQVTGLNCRQQMCHVKAAMIFKSIGSTSVISKLLSGAAAGMKARLGMLIQRQHSRVQVKGLGCAQYSHSRNSSIYEYNRLNTTEGTCPLP